MSIHLSPRLMAAARLVPPGARVIDVGTDHAMLPVWLAQEGAAAHVYASDVREGPLAGAAALVAETDTGGTVELRLTDGLAGFSRADADTVVITGMGGQTMVSILSAAPWLRDGVTLILSPHTKQDVLRRWLRDNGFAVSREMLVADAGRIYPILLAAAGAPPVCSEAELYTGLFRQISGDPLFGEYLSRLISRAGAAAPYDETAAALLRAYQEMKERLSHADRI